MYYISRRSQCNVVRQLDGYDYVVILNMMDIEYDLEHQFEPDGQSYRMSSEPKKKLNQRFGHHRTPQQGCVQYMTK